jgi:hypothetical protein
MPFFCMTSLTDSAAAIIAGMPELCPSPCPGAPGTCELIAVAPGSGESPSNAAQWLPSALLGRGLPAGGEDYAGGRLFVFSVGLRRAIEAAPDGADPDGAIELAALMVGDVVRRVGRRLEHDALDDPRAAADFVFATLPAAGAGDLGRLLGVSTKTIGAWRAGRPVTRNADRVVLVAQVLTHLRASMTPRGVVLWFDGPRAQLDGRTPLELLDQDGPAAAREPLTALARGLRGQLAD